MGERDLICMTSLFRKEKYTPFSCTAFHALLHGVVHFVSNVNPKNQFNSQSETSLGMVLNGSYYI